jgi:hypothetical protein
MLFKKKDRRGRKKKGQSQKKDLLKIRYINISLQRCRKYAKTSNCNSRREICGDTKERQPEILNVRVFSQGIADGKTEL